MGKAILTVSYGVRYPDEMRRSVTPVRRAVEAAFPGCAVCHALACGETADFLKQSGETGYTCREGIKMLEKRGFDDIRIVPLMLTPGRVYGDLVGMAGKYPVGRPLMDSDGDLLKIGALYGGIAARTGRDVLLMGHGSPGAGGEGRYLALREKLPPSVRLACRAGKPDFEDAAGLLNRNRGILLMPLMLAAGNHARQEMAGDGPDSWKNRLRAGGFDVEVRLEGMGSFPEVQAMFVEKAREIINTL